MFVNIHTHFTQKEGVFILNGNTKDTFNHLYSIGIHPNEGDKMILNDDTLEEKLKAKNCVALGECGLDKNTLSSIEKQISVFKLQISLSEKLKLPIIIHCVKAWNEIFVLKNELKPTQDWIYHGFRKVSILEQVLKSGCFISIGTAIIFDQNLQKAITKIPPEKLFLETDNDPDHSIEEVYEAVASLQKISLEALQKQQMINFKAVFKKANL